MSTPWFKKLTLSTFHSARHLCRNRSSVRGWACARCVAREETDGFHELSCRHRSPAAHVWHPSGCLQSWLCGKLHCTGRRFEPSRIGRDTRWGSGTPPARASRWGGKRLRSTPIPDKCFVPSYLQGNAGHHGSTADPRSRAEMPMPRRISPCRVD